MADDILTVIEEITTHQISRKEENPEMALNFGKSESI